MLDHDYGDKLANVHTDVSETCEWEEGCDVCAEYVVTHEGNTFYLCPVHMDQYEVDHPRCNDCGSGDPAWSYSWWDGFRGENVPAVVCGSCADMIRDADDGTVLVPLSR